jgi:hypothetical protein
MRLASVNFVRNIEFSQSGINGTGTLSARARRTLSVYVAAAKMGYEGISAPLGAIADAVYRTSFGEAASVRTLQRSNRELENAGYIRIGNLRIGKNSRCALIFFCLSSFSYWLQRRQKNVSPLPQRKSYEERCDNSPHATTCRTFDPTNYTDRVNSSYINKNSDKKQHAGARAINKSKQKRKKRSDVLFSLEKVLSNSGGDFCRQERRMIRARAGCEVKAMTAGIEIINHSGIDWAYWERRWKDFSIEVRESTVKREILPLLSGDNRAARGEIPLSTGTALAKEAITKDQIEKIRKDIEAKITLPIAAPATAPAQKQNENLLENDDDMRILIAARNRCAARKNCG